MDTKIIEHFQSNWRFYLSILYFTVLIIVLVTVYNRHSAKPAVAPTPVATPAPTVDLDPLNKRVAALEQELANHVLVTKTLRSEYDALFASNQKLERRIQSHLEAIKRMCEYIVVITVDKKIIPRQCLPEYRWSTTENN